jgi:hypothetical protein
MVANMQVYMCEITCNSSANSCQKHTLKSPIQTIRERARRDLNPRSSAPKADTLIRARLRALLNPDKTNNGVALKDLLFYLENSYKPT